MSGTVRVPMTVSYDKLAEPSASTYAEFDKSTWDAMSAAQREAAMDEAVDEVVAEYVSCGYDIDAAEEVQ